MAQDSKVLTEQIRAMDKGRLTGKVGTLSERLLRQIEQAIRNSLDYRDGRVIGTLVSARAPATHHIHNASVRMFRPPYCRVP